MRDTGAGTVKLYVDGVSQFSAPTAGSGFPNVTSVTLGGFPSGHSLGPGFYFTGEIGPWSVSDSAKSASQIAALAGV